MMFRRMMKRFFGADKYPDIYVKYDDDSKKVVIVNERVNRKIVIVDEGGELVNFAIEDLDLKRIDQLPHHQNAMLLYAPYYFSIGHFSDGVALVTWTLYPDGRYFADEGGFGGESNDETTVYGFIDENGNVLVKFRDMTDQEQEVYRKIAIHRHNHI